MKKYKAETGMNIRGIRKNEKKKKLLRNQGQESSKSNIFLNMDGDKKSLFMINWGSCESV